MYKKVLLHLIIIAILVTTFLIVFSNTKADHNRQIESLSNELGAIRDANVGLRGINTELVQRNTELADRTSELERQIVSNNNYYQGKLGKIGSSLIGISNSIGNSKASIREIIEGLGQLKKLIENL